MTRALTEIAYLQLQPDAADPVGRIHGFKVARVTRGKPLSLVEGAIVVKLRLTIQDEAFEQVPVVNVNVPMSAFEPVHVEATA